MSKFYGKVGFVKTTETSPGVWMPSETEKLYYGDITRLDRRWDKPTEVNDHLTLSEEINLLADTYILDNLSYIKWVEIHGVKWKVKTITPAYPRIRLTIGEEYNVDDGETSSTT